jgi:integrase
LVNAKLSRSAYPRATAEWLGGIDYKLRSRLVELDLAEPLAVPPPEAPKTAPRTLAAYIDSYIASRKNLKPNTIAHLKRCRGNIVKIMGGNRLLTSITVGDANRFRETLAETMAPNTVRRICGRAKQFFKAAVDDELIDKSPFRAMKDTNVRANKSRDHEIDRATADKIIAACPDAEWRLIFALARFGGFRCPSEHFALRWADVDWTAGTIRLDSPKTGERVLPLFAELRPYLEDAFNPESEFVIVANRSKANLRTRLMRIVEKAGLKPWPKLYQNLRASRASELAREYGAHTEAEWLGHSPEVAGEFYVRAGRDDFARAAGLNVERSPYAASSKSGAQAAHSTASSRRSEVLDGNCAAKNPGKSSIPRGSMQSIAPPRGLEPRTKRLTAACSTN